MKSHHILIVEDEAVTRTKLAGYFESEGYRVTAVGSAKEMRLVLSQEDISMLLLDINLPDESGLLLAREVRAKSNMGIVLVTGKTDDIDRIVGLEIGADDYVTKPFNTRELLARVTNLLRRIHDHSEIPMQHKSIYHFDGLVLDASRRHLLGRDQQEIKLTRAEFELLLVFIAHPSQMLNRDRLLSQVTHRSWDPNDRTIDVLIMRLRRKLERDYKHPTLFTTVHGEGYLFSGINQN
ncbi:MAG: two-component system response regulator TorR [Oceanospirillaceae bacterium]|nr:two-component system response regulator TorR [Pseudomonadales bacterium]|tara:strand:- start:147 stop:857 length:711 start_codon:yes stop_codon:yes gene_type:complete